MRSRARGPGTAIDFQFCDANSKGWGPRILSQLATQSRQAEAVLNRDEKFDVLRTALLELVRYEELNFTARQVAVLLECIRSPEETIKSMSETLQVSKPSISKTVSRLFGLGLLERKPHPTDRRVIFVVPTEAGRKLIVSLYAERATGGRTSPRSRAARRA